MKVKNIKTGVIKELKNEIEVSMYLGTGEWKLVEEKKESKPLSKPEEK